MVDMSILHIMLTKATLSTDEGQVTVPPPSRRQQLARLGRCALSLLLLGLAVHLILPQITALERSLQVVKRMAMWAIALAVGMQVLSYLGSGYLLRAIARMTGRQLSLLRGTLVFAAGVSVGQGGITPTEASYARTASQ